MILNALFIKNIYATYGLEGKLWLNDFSNHLKRLSDLWDFQIIHPVKDLSYNFVAIVKLKSGLAILKTAPPSARLIAEAEWLNAHKKSVPIIFKIDKKYNAYLMEKLDPGISLKYLVKQGNDEQATQVISKIILNLQSTSITHPMKYPHISEHASAFSFLRGHIDTNIINRATTLFNELSADRMNDVLLHGDLHHDNILLNDTSWTVIDPHGYIGNACAEVGPMIFNPLDCFPNHLSTQKIIEKRLHVLAEILPFGLDHIKAWTFCLTLRSIAWDIEGFHIPSSHRMEVANILYNLL